MGEAARKKYGVVSLSILSKSSCIVRVSIYALCEIIPSLKPSFKHRLFLFDSSLSSLLIFFVLVFLVALGLLLFHGRGFKRGRLRAVFILLRIFHHGGRVHWEVARLLRELVAVTQVHLLHLPILEEGEGARPDQRADDHNRVGNWLLDGWVFVAILARITAEAYTPAGLFEFRADFDVFIARNRLE